MDSRCNFTLLILVHHHLQYRIEQRSNNLPPLPCNSSYQNIVLLLFVNSWVFIFENQLCFVFHFLFLLFLIFLPSPHSHSRSFSLSPVVYFMYLISRGKYIIIIFYLVVRIPCCNISLFSVVCLNCFLHDTIDLRCAYVVR